MADLFQLIDQLERDGTLSREEFKILLTDMEKDHITYLRERARTVARRVFDNKIYTRGLIEFSNYCKNNCFYCGIRRGNKEVVRYRLTKEQILDCCKTGYELGFRTFVLQGGEDGHFTDDIFVDLIKGIKREYPDCAITLSLGERSAESYKKLYEAGADRYLLRHETATDAHYQKLHPEELSLSNRINCLKELKAIGFQVGAGFMVGSPGQTLDYIINDLLFLKELSPHMIGIGPFIPHHQTPFAKEKAGTLEQTLILLSVLRLMFPNVLLPATTALGTIHPMGREEGILSGANVVMPNLSPTSYRKQYELYDNKICTGDEAAECRFCLQRRMAKIGYELAVDRGDYKEISNL